MKTNLRKDIKDFLMGVDAELVLYTPSGKIAPLHGGIGEPMGYDGHAAVNRISEVRTIPSGNPEELINSIRTAFVKKVQKHPIVLKYNWQAGSFKNYGIGAHLHHNVPSKVIDYQTLTLVIGNYVGALSLALEDKKEAISRRNEGYGRLSDWRPQKWGMEVRCCSSFLTSPSVSIAHIALFKVVLYELLNNKSWSPKSRFSDLDFQTANQEKVRANFDSIWSEITQMGLYKKYKEYLDIFPFLINNSLTWFPKDADVKTAWGIADKTIPVSDTVSLTDIWKKSKEIF